MGVRTDYGAPKHGTELHRYRGDNPFADSHWDFDRQVFLPGPASDVGFLRQLGNMAVGTVTEIGTGVTGIGVGDRVVGYGPLRETQCWAWGTASAYPGVRTMTDTMIWQAAVCLDPATVALGAIRDGQVRLGDRVAMFGLRAIDLLAVQLARLAGATFVVAVGVVQRNLSPAAMWRRSWPRRVRR